MKPFVIYDWAGNHTFQTESFETFDDADEFLSEHLGDTYEVERGEYVIDERRRA